MKREGRVVSREADDRAAQLLVAEFQFVSGLIPFYRRAELIVLGATGALVSVTVAALATLEAAEGSQRQAEGVLLVFGSWVPVMLLLIEVMALTRIARASRYICAHLHPLACKLGRRKLLQFEHSPGDELRAMVEDWRDASGKRRGASPSDGSGRGRLLLLWEPLVMTFFSSAPLILVISVTSVALAAGGIALDLGALTLGVGLPAAVAAAVLGWHGITFTRAHEGRMGATMEMDSPQGSGGEI